VRLASSRPVIAAVLALVAACSEDTATEGDWPPPGAELVLGTHPAGATDPATFSPLHDGDPLTVELGFQGLWMVTLGLQTHDLFTPPVDLTATLSVADAPRGALSLAGQPLTLGPDGYAYFLNVFVVLDDPAVAGQLGTVSLAVRDAAGHTRTAAVEVRLFGGP